MKYLYLLGSILRSHFNKEQRKYTISAMLMFFFSSFLMLFAASVMGSDFLFSNEEEEIANTTYYFFRKKGDDEKDKIAASEYVINAIYAIDSNQIDHIDVHISNMADSNEKIGTKNAQTVELMPILKGSCDERLRFSFWLGPNSLGSYNAPYHSEQNIIDGREITPEEIEEGEYVIVLPEDYGIKAGEEIRLLGEKYTVAGITSDSYARIPAAFLESPKFEEGGFSSEIYMVDFDKPMKDETYDAINQAVFESTGKEVDHYEKHPPLPGEPTMAFLLLMGVLGTVIALFSIFGIYYPTLRLCKETMPMLSVLKLCGMRMLPVLGLLVLSILACFGVSFGLASGVLILTEDIFSRSLVEYGVKGLYFSVSAIIFVLVAAVAIAPPMIKMAKSQPSEEEENG